MALIRAETAAMVVLLALLVIVKVEPDSVPEEEGTTFIKFNGNDIDKDVDIDCLEHDKVRILKDFLPVHDELDPTQYRCQLPHGKPEEEEDEDEDEDEDKDEDMDGGEDMDVDMDEEGEWKKTQYVTLFNAEDKIPIFSAYKAEPYIDPGTKETKETGDRAEMAWEEAAVGSPKSSDYKQFKGYDRGHLFPVRLASDPIQAQATMKLTNAVPQNSIFNRVQWNWAGEYIFMTTVVLECQKKPGNTPVVFTGAVPDYWGDLENQNFQFDFPFEAFKRRADKIRVPTHMWSACFCVAARGAVDDFLGFIGVNLRVGRVKWYSSFDTFDKTLVKMYRIKAKPKFFPFNSPIQYDELRMKNVLNDAWAESKSFAVNQMMELPLSNDGPEYWKWNMVNMVKEEIQAEIDGLSHMLQQIDPNNGHAVASINVGSKRGRGVRRKREERRKKRNVNTSPVHSKYALIKVVDESSTSNLSLTTCTFKETYDGGEETHELNLEEGAFIKDSKPTGEVELSAVVNENLMPERASTHQHISIVLTGRN